MMTTSLADDMIGDNSQAG